MRSSFLPVCGLFLCSGFLLAQGAGRSDGPFTLEQVMSAPFPTDLVASPRGNRIAWIFDAQGLRNIWVAEGPEFKPRQLTSYMDDHIQELSEISFSADGHTNLYLRGGAINSIPRSIHPSSHPAG